MRIASMTPTEQEDKELREAIIGIVEAEYKSPNYTPAVKRVDYIMQLITADRKRVALEARIDEISHVFRIVDGRIFWQSDISLAMPLEERIAELKAQQEEV